MPGRQFREIAFKFGIRAARGAFRLKADKIARLENVFQNTYAGLTRLSDYLELFGAIDQEELGSWGEKPLGGHSQDVYRAKWTCPHRLGMPSAKTYDVILKRIWPPGAHQLGSRTEDQQLREVGRK